MHVKQQPVRELCHQLWKYYTTFQTKKYFWAGLIPRKIPKADTSETKKDINQEEKAASQALSEPRSSMTHVLQYFKSDLHMSNKILILTFWANKMELVLICLLVYP